MDMDTPFTCQMCGVESKGFGNNPQPLLEDVDSRVCDDCNSRFVIPARLLGLGGNEVACRLVVKLAELGRTFSEGARKAQELLQTKGN